jgi:hypothetical protein
MIIKKLPQRHTLRREGIHSLELSTTPSCQGEVTALKARLPQGKGGDAIVVGPLKQRGNPLPRVGVYMGAPRLEMVDQDT